MMNLIERLTGKRSAKSAKDRLQLVLINDRTDISPAVLDAIKDEILQVISRHIEIDAASVHIAVENEGRSQRLVADIPIKTVGRRRTV